MKALRRSVSGPAVPQALQIPNKDDKHPGRVTDEGVLAEITNFLGGRCLNAAPPSPKCPVCPPPPPPPCRQDNAPDQDGRNRIIYDLKLIIDRRYEVYAKNYEQVADSTSFFGEISAGSLSGVATIVGDAGEKAILALASTLTQSTVTSAQKNFYQKQTAYAILAVMDSQRATKWKDILQLMPQDLARYPLSAALGDLAEYRRLGTAVAALESIQKDAGATEAAAKAASDKAQGINQTPTSLSVTTTSSSLQTAAFNPYSAKLQATGGVPPYTWAVTSGTLPSGLSLDSSTGIISGTPTAHGTSNFTVTVTDSDKPNAKTATASLSIAVP